MRAFAVLIAAAVLFALLACSVALADSGGSGSGPKSVADAINASEKSQQQSGEQAKTEENKHPSEQPKAEEAKPSEKPSEQPKTEEKPAQTEKKEEEKPEKAAKAEATREFYSKFRPTGPLPTLNNHPLYLMFLTMLPEPATVLPKGARTFSYRLEIANVFTVETDSVNLIYLDFESERQTFEYRMNPSGRYEISVAVPVYYQNHGFLDSTIQGWHSFFGLPNGYREDYLNDDFHYLVHANGSEVINTAPNNFMLGDISAQVKVPLARETKDRPAVALRLGVKAPTGSAKIGYGSGHPDAGVGVALQKGRGRWDGYANLNYVFVGGSSFRGELPINSSLSFMLGTEYQANHNTSVLGQFYFEQNPLTTTDKYIDRDSLTMSLGWAHHLRKDLLWYGGFSEDIKADTAPDFTAFTELIWRLRNPWF